MSPYKLVFGHKAMISHELEIRHDAVVSRTFTEYYEQLKRNLNTCEIDYRNLEVKGQTC